MHGDYRLDNLMFPPVGDGAVALDWQTVGVGPPARDIAYFLGNSLERAERQAHEEVLVGRYHEALRERGVATTTSGPASTTTASGNCRDR